MNLVIKGYTLSECMQSMAQYAQAYEKLGGENLIFCEDRLTLVAEKAIIRQMGGSFRTSVTTFSRFIQWKEQTLSKQGSVMAVAEVMAQKQRQGALHCFTSLSSAGGNARCIYETLAQFAASEITPEVLKETAEKLPEDVLKRKIADLAEIYDGYATFLEEQRYVDESRYLSLLPRRIREQGLLKGKNVFFLCYDSFTAQAQETVRAALETAENVVGIFISGEEDLYANHAVDTFQRVCGEYGKVTIRDLGVPLSGEAEVLRRGLFNPQKRKEKTVTEHLCIFEGEDKTAEAEYVAVKIRRAMAEDSSLRYRDIAVLVSDVAAYSLPVKKALDEYKIPYFIDEKKSLQSHPLAQFLLSALRVVKERFSPVAVHALAQNYFFGESDEYRNYLLKFANYRGGAKKEIKDIEIVREGFDYEVLCDGRERLLKATERIKTKGHGREYCRAVRALMQDFDAENKLKNLQESILDVAHKGYLAQIWRAIEGVLAEAELLLADKELTTAEFLTVLEEGLAATEIALIPLKSDAVFIGDVTDSRIEKVSVLFAVGMTDAVPRTAVDAAIVSDKEIARLKEVKTLLEPTVTQVNLRARESVCLNLCTFTDALHLIYSFGQGEDGTASEVFRYVDELFCGIDNKPIRRRTAQEEEDFAYACSAFAPALRQLLYNKNAYEDLRFSASQQHLQNYGALDAALQRLEVSERKDFQQQDEGHVRVEEGKDLFFRDGKISPTALEKYFSCPFQNFIERGLKLKEREEAAVLAVDTGNFVHELLERTAVRAKQFETEDEMRAYAMEIGAQLLKGSIYTAQQDTQSGLVFSEKLLKEGADVAVGAYRQIKNSEFQVKETEASVDGEFFHGKVDRVDVSDEYVRIIDYKTGKIDDSPTSYYTGRKLQLQLYMSEMQGTRTPAGVFYFPASVDYTAEDEGRFSMKGFMNGSEKALLCGDKNLTEEKKSEYFSASLKNSPAAKKIMDEDTFRYFLDYAVFVARQAVNELKDGNIQPSPYEKSCAYCKYGGMCSFCKDVVNARKVGTVDPATIAGIAKKIKEGGSGNG